MMKKRVAVLLSCLLCLAIAGTAEAAPERFEVPAFGLSFQPPAGWHTVSKDLAANIKKFDLSEKERADILKSSPRGTVLKSMLKHDPKTRAGMIPTINVIALPNGTKDAKQLLAALKASTDASAKSLSEFSYTVEPRIVSVGGVQSVELAITFAMPVGGQKTFVRSRSLAIPIGSALIQVSFSEPADEKNDEVYKQFEQSIQVAK